MLKLFHATKWTKHYINEYGQHFSVNTRNGSGELERRREQLNRYRGYYQLTVSLCDGRGSTKVFYPHRLVAELFVPNPNGYEIVNHKDGNKRNNYYKNLEWTTIQGNAVHASKTGLLPSHKGKYKKYDQATYDKIHTMYSQNLTIKQISLDTGIPYDTVWAIAHRTRGL